MDQRQGNNAAPSNDFTEHTRWNFAAIVSESASFQTGRAWSDPSAVLPLFIAALTPSTVVIGLIPVLQRLGFLLPQLPMASVVGHRPRRAPYLRWGVLVGRFPFLLFVAYFWMRGLSSPGTVLWFLLLSYFSVALGNGFVAIPWQDIIAKSIPPRLRGRFWGTLMFTHAIAAFGVGFVVRHLLGPHGPGFPRSYLILFTLSAVFYTMSTIGCALIREPIRPVLKRREPLRKVIAAARPLLARRPEFRSLVSIGVVAFGVVFTMPFYIVYATGELGIEPEMAGVYIWAAMLGGAFFSLLWGRLNDRRGPRAVLRAGCLFAMLAPLLAISIPIATRAAARALPPVEEAMPYLFGLVFVVGQSAMGALFMGTINYVFGLATDEERPRYIGLFNTLSAPGAAFPLAVGWLLNSLPFPAVLAMLAACGAGVVVLSQRMPQPKTERAFGPDLA